MHEYNLNGGGLATLTDSQMSVSQNATRCLPKAIVNILHTALFAHRMLMALVIRLNANNLSIKSY